MGSEKNEERILLMSAELISGRLSFRFSFVA